MSRGTMFADRVTEWKGGRRRGVFAASALAHAGLALLLFNLALPQTAERTGLRAVTVYAPRAAARKRVTAPAKRRTLPLPPMALTPSKLLPLPPPLILPAPAPAMPVAIPEM